MSQSGTFYISTLLSTLSVLSFTTIKLFTALSLRTLMRLNCREDIQDIYILLTIQGMTKSENFQENVFYKPFFA